MPVYYQNFKKFLVWFDLFSVLYCSYPSEILPVFKILGDA